MFGRKKSLFEEPAPDPTADATQDERDEPRPALPTASGPEEQGRDLPWGTMVGPGVTMEGKLRFSGLARIDGRFQGKIDAGGRLVVGTSGEVQADVLVDTLVLEGKIVGNVVASDGVEILSGGQMRGDIKTTAIQVHRGALFNGHCEMGE